MKWKYAGASIGTLVILGNLAIFFSPPFRLWLEGPLPFSLFVIEFLVFFIAWGGGLTGIMLPLFPRDEETPVNLSHAWHRIATALSIGGFLTWCCMAAVENAWDWSKGPSVVTLQFFTTWSFAAAICLVQEALPLPKLPRVRLVLSAS